MNIFKQCFLLFHILDDLGLPAKEFQSYHLSVLFDFFFSSSFFMQMNNDR